MLLNGATVFYGSFDPARQLDLAYAKENLLTVKLRRGLRGTPLARIPLEEVLREPVPPPAYQRWLRPHALSAAFGSVLPVGLQGLVRSALGRGRRTVTPAP